MPPNEWPRTIAGGVSGRRRRVERRELTRESPAGRLDALAPIVREVEILSVPGGRAPISRAIAELLELLFQSVVSADLELQSRDVHPAQQPAGDDGRAPGSSSGSARSSLPSRLAISFALGQTRSPVAPSTSSVPGAPGRITIGGRRPAMGRARRLTGSKPVWGYRRRGATTHRARARRTRPPSRSGSERPHALAGPPHSSTGSDGS